MTKWVAGKMTKWGVGRWRNGVLEGDAIGRLKRYI